MIPHIERFIEKMKKRPVGVNATPQYNFDELKVKVEKMIQLVVNKDKLGALNPDMTLLSDKGSSTYEVVKSVYDGLIKYRKLTKNQMNALNNVFVQYSKKVNKTVVKTKSVVIPY